VSGIKDGGMQVIYRAAAILRVLDSKSSSLGAIAKATGLARSTVQRIVDALAAESLVEAGAGGVRLSWGILQLAKAAQTDVALKARPALETLFARTHETVDISTSHGGEVAFLDRIISDQELRVVPINDRPRPLYAMANGKAVLSLMTDDAITKLMAVGLAPLTPRTITSRAALQRDIIQIRVDGFSYDREEHAPGVCAIGIPIQIPGMNPHAVSVVMPAYRFDRRLDELREALLRCKAAIELLFA
jgi:IclR family acetate operon transcriptional repressor